MDVTAGLGAAPPYDAVVFDLDGVVTDTAAIHAVAWKRLFDAVLADSRVRTDRSRKPFDPDVDYRRYVDGRRRQDGVAAFLGSRDVDIPMGREGDPPEAWTIHGLAARKNELFLAEIDKRGVRAFPGSVALIGRLRAGGVPLGLVTASRNAATLLLAAGLDAAFDVVVDGTVAATLGLPGKPDPATFLEAARRLGVAPERTVVIEDAESGVLAARRGRFGLVVGIDRVGHRTALEAAGADVVLGDVSQLDLGAMRTDPWLLVYDGFDPAHERHREALTTVGNGYMATRGAAAEARDDGVHYPGTYLAGVYNRLSTDLQGRRAEDEHLVNVPNWLLFDVRAGSGPWWSSGVLQATGEHRELDLRRGVLTRSVVLLCPDGRRLHVVQRRLVSMDRPHLAAMQTTITPQGWSGTVNIRSGIDAGVENTNVVEYRALASRHLVTLAVDLVDDNTVVVEVETSQSHVRIATAARTVVSTSAPVEVSRLQHNGERHWLGYKASVKDGQPLTVEKTVAVTTSRDPATASPRDGALDQLAQAPGAFDELARRHERAWRRLWGRFGIELDADRQTQLTLNLHVFHLLQAISPHTAAVDAGVPARGLHGEGYRGHVFWDELFVLPLVTMRTPEVTRALLDYRWRRLDAARQAARAAGLDGALFPWQSGSDGREETPGQLFNLRSGRWMPDNSRRQRHVGLAIAYNAWQYYLATGDASWLSQHGADLVVEVARLFASLASYDPTEDRYHITGVMGPDEYHDGYPDAPGSGLRDNAYTNAMAAWVCERAAEIFTVLAGHDCDELAARLEIEADEIAAWDQLSRRLSIPFHEGVISQFAGYESLAELDWDHYRSTYGNNIGRLDLILEAERDSTNRYKLAKQADVLMLLYLLGPDELTALLGRLNYDVGRDVLERSVAYYLARTAHGSTLSRVVHASVLAASDVSKGWSTFRDALSADLDDTQGGTTGEGVHLGAMAGTVDLVLRTFAGMRLEPQALRFRPRLPAELHRVGFQVRYRGQRVDVALDQQRLRARLHPCAAALPVTLEVAGQRVTLEAGQSAEFHIQQPRDGTFDPAAASAPATDWSAPEFLT